jgi:hypothetical protein
MADTENIRDMPQRPALNEVEPQDIAEKNFPDYLLIRTSAKAKNRFLIWLLLTFFRNFLCSYPFPSYLSPPFFVT